VTVHQNLPTQQETLVGVGCDFPLQRIAIVRALPGLGDFLCAIPALRALRRAFPQAHITFIGLPHGKGWAERFRAYIDEFVVLPGYPGLPEQPIDAQRSEQCLADLRSCRFDLAIQMHGSGVITNALTLELQAARTAGFYLPSHSCPDPKFFLPYQESESEIRRYLRLLEFLGIPAQDDQLEFPIWSSDWEDLKTVQTLCGLCDSSVEEGTDHNYVCIHPGASTPSRCWHGAQFAAVADTIARMGYQVVLTGSVAERGLAQAIADMMQAPALNLAGRTSLGSLAALLSKAKLLVCNDTGVSHLGVAVRVPSVVIFSASDPQRWAPLDQQRHRSIYPPSEVSLMSVLKQVNDLLQQEPSYVA
jgi:ADP-heptose:LPS heptosyltransferase